MGIEAADSCYSWLLANSAFIEAFVDAFQALPEGYPRPSVERINRVLAESDSSWLINPPFLIHVGERPEPIPIQELPENLDTKAKELIHTSFSKAEKLLAEKSNGSPPKQLFGYLKLFRQSLKD